MPPLRRLLVSSAALVTLTGGLLTGAFLAGAAVAQKPLAGPRTNDPDLRDVVKLQGGELRGRVVNPFATDEVELLVDGRKRRIPLRKIEGMVLVRDHIREFLKRRRTPKSPDSAASWGWLLVEWAHSQGLYHLAELQAMDLALEHDHADAHRYLGHKRYDDRWLWNHDGKWRDFAGLEEAITSWGSAMVLRSEHFSIRCNGGVHMAVHALLDLEALYLWWGDEFGAALQMQEVFQEMRLHVHRSPKGFPRWGQPVLPWFDPDRSGDVVRTHVDDSGERPELLFQCGGWLILWHAVAGDPVVNSEDERINPWLEMGLAGYGQLAMGGEPGRAAPLESVDPMRTCLQAANLPIRLQTHVQLPIYAGYYLEDSRRTRQVWGSATALATWLLDFAGDERRKGFLEYARVSLKERKGTASTLWKRHLGARVEELEGPWRGWVRSIAGV